MNNNVLSGIAPLVPINDREGAGSQVGAKGRKWSQKTGWLDGTITSAAAATEDKPNDLFYHVKFSDGSIESPD